MVSGVIDSDWNVASAIRYCPGHSPLVVAVALVMDMSHNRSASGSSTLTNASTLSAEEFIHNLQDASGIVLVVKAIERYSTQGLVDKAKSLLSKFERDLKRFEKYPSSIPTVKPIDPHLVLVAMLDFAPNDRGRRYVAAAIVS